MLLTRPVPLQEAMKSTKSAERYFNALRRMDWKAYKAKTEGATFDKFVCVHLVCATREVRPDIVRLLFQNVTNTAKLHQVWPLSHYFYSQKLLTYRSKQYVLLNFPIWSKNFRTKVNMHRQVLLQPTHRTPIACKKANDH